MENIPYHLEWLKVDILRLIGDSYRFSNISTWFVRILSVVRYQPPLVTFGRQVELPFKARRPETQSVAEESTRIPNRAFLNTEVAHEAPCQSLCQQ